MSAGTHRQVTRPSVKLPRGSTDCHVHLFDGQRFPFAAKRAYTPGTALLGDLLAFEDQLGIERVVLVQPSVYGTDNAAMLDGLQRLGPEKARGVAVIDLEQAQEKEISELHAHGVRSIRLNLAVNGERDHSAAIAQLQRAAEVVGHAGWSVQIYADVDVIAAMSDAISSLKVRVVLDHFAGVKASRKADQAAAFATVIELLKGGNVYTKLSAPYRASRNAPDYEDVRDFAIALIEAGPDRVIWASDWPHTGSASSRTGGLDVIEPFRDVDAGHALNQILKWAGNEDMQRRILVDNPARLYDFGPLPA
ncbi:amidohydrolase family protein [Paraburkholderia tropica]|uniref:amidohydrolase family protein n=1 Tax=Paraburkholderia tropica TaxID=92647 RepID=UPI002AB05CD5|nr:amidohydrolase family protein [Paraburkholderia tropica]